MRSLKDDILSPTLWMREHEVAQGGGAVVAPRFEVPGVVVLGLFTDPAGNPMGLVEMAGDRRVIPNG